MSNVASADQGEIQDLDFHDMTVKETSDQGSRPIYNKPPGEQELPKVQRKDTTGAGCINAARDFNLSPEEQAKKDFPCR